MNDRNQLIESEKQRIRRKREALKKKKERQANTKKSIRKIFLFLIVFVITFILYDGNLSIDTSGIKIPSFKLPSFNFKPSKKKDNNSNKVDEKNGIIVHKELVNNLSNNTVAFVPMDDLPLHSTWLSNLMESSNLKIEMPETKYYRTQLGENVNSYAEFTTQYGNPNKIASWLLEMENDGCNNYIISIDQLFSGGLIPSSYVNNNDFVNYSGDYSKVNDILTKIINNKENKVYLIDTITSLSVEKDFMNITEEDHNNLLKYSSIERNKLNDKDLTIKNISNEYLSDKSGKVIETTLDTEKLDKYLEARTRKLKLSKNIIDSINKSPNKKNIKIFYGYDGKISNNDIKVNDIAYIKNNLEKNNIDYIISPNNTTIDLVAITKMYTDNIDKKLTVSVHYFGDSKSIIPEANYTYEDYMNELLDNLNIKVSNKGYIDILVYTECKDNNKCEDITKDLLNKYISNIKSHIPTILINGSVLEKDKVLLEKLKSINILGYLIGYSNNGGFINSSKYALFEGITRYIYLSNSTKKDNADRNYLKGLTYSFVNDLVYLNSPLTDNDINVLDSFMNANSSKLLESLEKSNYISNLVKYEESGIKSLKLYNFKYPWSRTNEISFVVSVATGQEKEINLDKVLPKEQTKEETQEQTKDQK